jgi:integrase
MTKQRLTKTRVDAARGTGGNQAFLWCIDPARFGLRISGTGKKTFVIQYKDAAGRSRRHTIGSYGPITVEQARTEAKRLLAEVALGGDPASARKAERAAPSMGELCGRYLEEHARVHKRPSSVRADELNIEKHVKPALGSLLVREVTRQHIADLHSDMRETPFAANRNLSLVAKILQCAIDWGLIETNPARGIRRYRETRRDRFLSESEFARLGAMLRQADTGGKEDRFIVGALRLLALSGLRLGEVLSLEWRDVDLDRGRLTLRDAKAGTRIAIINPPMMEILTELARNREAAIEKASRGSRRAREDSAYVIPGRVHGRPVSGIHHVWTRIREAANLSDLRIHDLRHSFASHAAAGGLSLVAIGGLLGHKSPQTTSRYIDWADDPLRDASSRVASRISAAMEAAAPDIPDNVRPLRR